MGRGGFIGPDQGDDITWKIKLEPGNHRVVEENRLPFSGSILIFQGIIYMD